MTTQQTNWTEYTGSDEQNKELDTAPNGYIVRYIDVYEIVEMSESIIVFGIPDDPQIVLAYWLIPDDPLREMKVRQAQTGQPVYIRISGNAGIHCAYSQYRWTGTHSIWVTTTPDWHIPNAEYSFTPWED